MTGVRPSSLMLSVTRLYSQIKSGLPEKLIKCILRIMWVGGEKEGTKNLHSRDTITENKLSYLPRWERVREERGEKTCKEKNQVWENCV